MNQLTDLAAVAAASGSWHFEVMRPSGTITATEPDGRKHVVLRGDLRTTDGVALLNAMVRDLTRPAATLTIGGLMRWIDDCGRAVGTLDDRHAATVLLGAYAAVCKRSALPAAGHTELQSMRQQRDASQHLADRQRDVLDRIVTMMALAGVAGASPLNYTTIPDLLGRALVRLPVAYGIFADIPDEGWVLQFPNYRTQRDAELAAGTFTVGRVEVRPLYA